MLKRNRSAAALWEDLQENLQENLPKSKFYNKVLYYCDIDCSNTVYPKIKFLHRLKQNIQKNKLEYIDKTVQD